MLVSPAEPEKLRRGFQVSSLPERWGCDFVFFAHGTKVGVQRKAIPDLIASVHDGRLAREVAMMDGQIDVKVLIVEGTVKWSNDGEMMGNGYGVQWNKRQFRGVLWSCRAKGLWIEYTADVGETLETLAWLEAWFSKGKHQTLDRRPGPTSLWGKPTHVDYAKHLVMGLPSVGPELAARIVDRFGIPFTWKITRDDLVKVEGIGKKKAETIYAALEEQ